VVLVVGCGHGPQFIAVFVQKMWRSPADID